MARIARAVVPAQPHHITQRGNDRQDVFFVDDDRRKYLSLLKEQSEKYGLKIVAYCLMTNHLHLIVIPESERSLGDAVGRTHWKYTRYINRLHKRSGHLWQNRFFSCVLDDDHLLAAMIYVERNPVRTGLVKSAWNYKWSSADAHTRGADENDLINMDIWRQWTSHDEWRNLLIREDDNLEIKRIRSCTLRGRPLASDVHMKKFEKITGRKLRPNRVGRPKKKIGEMN